MRVRENKWHYKLHNIVRDPFTFIEFRGDYSRISKQRPRSLCGYFWSTVACTLGLILLAIFALVVVVGLIVTLPVWIIPAAIAFLLVRRHDRKEEEENRRLAEAEKFKWDYINEHGWDAWWKYYDKNLRQKVIFGEPKDPNIVWEYIKALKSRACPLIEIVPEEK